MHNLFFNVSVILYLIATISYFIYFVKPQKKKFQIAITLIVLAFIIHTISWAMRFYVSGYPPFVILHETLSFFAWVIVFIYLIFHAQYRIEIIGVFVSPLVSVLTIISFTLPNDITPLAPILKSFWMPIHITLCFLGEGIFSLAFCIGIMYLIQERQIKKKRLSTIYHRLPSLKVLDDLNYKCLTIGFPLLTLGIITGSIWAEFAWGSYWSWDPKETWSLITWFIYAALLHGRLNVGWKGRRAAKMAILGFICVMFTFLGVNLLLPGLHSYV
ncbi:MAG: c-type cytochrome biogenesis protein CcsB [Thermodesulfobacteriota bacterium]|nr:c-type cytochrome biogenesis protein CcsB [Thermodesulfobacteriota bacterium]